MPVYYNPYLQCAVKVDHPLSVSAPVNSDEYPTLLLLGMDETFGYEYDGEWQAPHACGQCGRLPEDWPQTRYSYGPPGAMFNADIYCADCVRYSYAPETGELCHTLSGEPLTE